MKRLLMLGVLLFAIACSGADLDDAVFAVDADQSGAVDCADLDHVLACVHHPDAAVCAHADVNHDGVVDDGDVHDLHAGLTATHHDCATPDHHDPDGHHVPEHPGEHGDHHHDDGHHHTDHATDHHTDGMHDETPH